MFGAKTEEAVKVFQERMSLSVDGIVGLKNWEALEKVTGSSFQHSLILRNGSCGEEVKTLQKALNKIDSLSMSDIQF